MKSNYILIALSITLAFIACDKVGRPIEYYCDEKFELLIKYMNMPRPTDSYDYPVRPCMNKWKELTATEEKLKACVIPISSLKNMSTQAVIQALWEYPFAYEPVSEIGSRNIQKDFETIFYNNNAYKELLLREDAGIFLLKRYELVDAVSREKMFMPLILELLISQPNFLSLLSAEERRQIVVIAFEKDSKRIESGIFGEPGRYSTWMLIARTMLNADYLPFANEVLKNDALKRFIDTSIFFVETIEELEQLKQLIINNAKNFINAE